MLAECETPWVVFLFVFKLFAFFLWPVLNNKHPAALELEERGYTHSELSCEGLESRSISIY